MNRKIIKDLRRSLPYALSILKSPLASRKAYEIIRNPGQISEHDLDELTRNALASGWPPVVLARLAESLYLHGRFDEALRLLHNSNSSVARMMEGWLRLYLGEYARTLDMFSAFAESPKTRIEALKNKAFSLYLLGRHDEAVTTLITAIALSPANTPAITLLSRIVRHRSEIEQLLAEIQRLSRTAITATGSAQLVRACARAGANDEGMQVARNAVINMAFAHAAGNRTRDVRITESGMPEGSYSSGKGSLILDHFARAVSGRDIRFFLMGGTLLGMIRDKQLLPWDKDLDLGCFASEASIGDLWEIFTASPYFIPMGTADDRLLKLRHVTGVTVDIFINFTDGDEIWHGGQFVSWRWKKFGIKPIEYGGQQFYIPDPAEGYLENHYGLQWKTPDPAYDVFWEAPDVFNIKPEHRYQNTIAKGIQMLAAGSRASLETRLHRAEKGGANDVVDGYRYVLNIYDQYYRTDT